MTVTAPIIVPTPVIVPSGGGNVAAGTAHDNWTVLLWALVAAAAMLLIAWYLRRIGRLISHSDDEFDWPPWAMIGRVCTVLAAVMALVLAVVAYIVLLAHGWVTGWSLLVPAAVVAYAVRRAERFIAAKRAAEHDGADR